MNKVINNLFLCLKVCGNKDISNFAHDKQIGILEEGMKISIKNMMCPRCIMVVNNLLTSMGYKPVEVALGYAILERDSMSDEERREIGRRLEELGFELMEDSDTVIVERIKIAVLRFARTEEGMKIKLSQALEEELKLPYKTLTGLFSQHENRTIENYFISQRIEYVKELISYNEMSLKEIAFKTGYSSVAYLSKQFAQVVGMTISEFRNFSATRRNSVTNV